MTVTLHLPFNDTLSDSLYNGEEDLKLITKFVMTWKEEDLQNNERDYDLDNQNFEFRQVQEFISSP